jgi:hypothetical protein
VRGHVAAAVIDEQARHILAQWGLNPTLRIASFIRHQSPGSEQARSRLGLSDIWRRDHTPNETKLSDRRRERARRGLKLF